MPVELMGDEQRAFVEAALDKMDDEQQEHFKLLVLSLLGCYSENADYGVVLIANRRDPSGLQLFAVNSNDIDAAHLVNTAKGYLQHVVMQDAPPREMYS
jgi:hypothetical protein